MDESGDAYQYWRMRRREQRTLCVCGENEAAVAQSEFTLAFQETDIDRPALCRARS